MDQALIYNWYEQYKNGIYRYVFSITKDACLAEDILHDTFVKVLSGEHAFAAGKARAWLYRVARNLCYDQLRRGKREQSQMLLRPEAFMDPYGYIDMIASLSETDREIVTLKIVGGLTHGEIGAVLGITARAAQKRYERAIATLREKED